MNNRDEQIKLQKMFFNSGIRKSLIRGELNQIGDLEKDCLIELNKKYIEIQIQSLFI